MKKISKIIIASDGCEKAKMNKRIELTPTRKKHKFINVKTFILMLNE